AIDHLRSRQRAAVPAAELPEIPVRDSDPGDSPWPVVAQLPPKQRMAVALRYALDADYTAIAATMEISEEAARRNVHEGLKRLREEYGRDGLA
ncbi:MAG TPA: sigma-70 family RNA polymerase sigma factor, partial [Solirubrobacteraceae bacterium]|nr:sigma-70 family RNA polymerase sigma factor [Solirubrobacteraceae bacterium]